jgi:hypothetical protein
VAPPSLPSHQRNVPILGTIFTGFPLIKSIRPNRFEHVPTCNSESFRLRGLHFDHQRQTFVVQYSDTERADHYFALGERQLLMLDSTSVLDSTSTPASDIVRVFVVDADSGQLNRKFSFVAMNETVIVMIDCAQPDPVLTTSFLRVAASTADQSRIFVSESFVKAYGPSSLELDNGRAVGKAKKVVGAYLDNGEFKLHVRLADGSTRDEPFATDSFTTPSVMIPDVTGTPTDSKWMWWIAAVVIIVLLLVVTYLSYLIYTSQRPMSIMPTWTYRTAS